LRVLVCPTAFKESLSATRVTEAIAAGVRAAVPGASVRFMPVSDGGPGLLDAIATAEGGEFRTHSVRGPLGEPVEARSLWISPVEAVIESAEACGLHLVPEGSRDPMRADTRGLGDLASLCIGQGAARLAIGLGGSATVDGGAGMARVFGYRLLDGRGTEIPAGGGGLADLARIERGASIGSVAMMAIADVRSPLTGPDGAARRFASQKGAGPSQVERLEAGLACLGVRLRDDLGRDVAGLPGAGAAGGLGAGCAAFLDADLVAGSDWMLARLDFDRELAGAGLVITGEGAWDGTSGLGKITAEVLRRARAAAVDAILVTGAVEGPTPHGVKVVGGSKAWLDADDIARLVAEALG